MKKKIIIDRTKIDAIEIASRQDFSKIINQIPATTTSPFYQTGWFYTTLASVALIVVLSSVMLYQPLGEKQNELVTTHSEETGDLKEKDTSEKDKFLYDEDIPCINPPSSQLDVPFTIYKVNGAKGGKITHSTGTEVQIPSNTFLDQNGKIIESDIYIHFREINNPVDMMLSGIPMHYDSSNFKNNLLSEGMIEILGFHNDKPVAINETKSIAITLSSKSQKNDFNVYYLDEKNKKWDYKGKPKLVLSGVQNSSKTNENDNDKSTLATIEKEVLVTQNLYETAVKNTTEYKKLEPEKPISKGNKDRQFVLDVDSKEFPELSVYKNLIFEVEKNDPNFSPSVYNENWTDVSLSEKEKGKTYYLTLFKSGAKKTFSVFPVFSGADLDIAMNNFNKSFQKYENELNKKIEKEQLAKENYENQLAKWEKAKDKSISKIEASLNDGKPSILARVLNATSFGIWNIDKYVSFPKGNPEKVIFKDTKGNELAIIYAQHFEKGKNTVYTYYPNDFLSFEYNENEQNTIVVFLGTGKVGIVKNEALSISNSQEIRTITLQIQPLNDELIAELRKEALK